MRAGDLRAILAYGTGLTFTITLYDNSTPPVPVNVSGYTARMQVLKYDGSTFGTPVLTLTSALGQITVGGSNGRFVATISALQSSALAAVFGSPPPAEPANMRFFVTPGGGSETEIAHGVIALRESGAAVDPIVVDVYEDSFAVNVDALALVGPAGPPGTGSISAKAVILTPTSHASVPASSDGVALSAGDKVLDVAASTQAQRGLWYLGTPWTRTSDTHTPSMTVVVEQGDAGRDLWQLNATSPFTIDVTAQAWNRVDGSAQRNNASTASTSPVTIVDIPLERGTSWTLRFTATIRSGTTRNVLRFVCTGDTDASGTTTNFEQSLEAWTDGELGTVEATAIAGAKLRLTALAGSAAATTFDVAYYFEGSR